MDIGLVIIFLILKRFIILVDTLHFMNNMEMISLINYIQEQISLEEIKLTLITYHQCKES